MDRRTFLSSTTSLVAIGLSGCSTLSYLRSEGIDRRASSGEDDGRPTTIRRDPRPTEESARSESDSQTTRSEESSRPLSTSFNASSLPSWLTNMSESGAEPLVVSASESILQLSSKPGTRSKARVTTADPFSLPLSCAVRMKLPESFGREYSVTLTLIHPQTTARVSIHASPWYGAVRLVGRNSTTLDEPSYARSIAPWPSEGRWHDFELSIREGQVVATFDDRSQSGPIPTPMPGGEVYASVGANGWGMGDPVSISVDSFRVD